MQPVADALATATEPFAEPLAPKLRLLCLESLDKRRVSSKRTYELIASFEAELGGELTLADKLAVKRAAMLSALAEHEASRQMAGDPVDLDQCVRIANAAQRAIAALRLPARSKRPSTEPTLAEHLARFAERQRARAST